MSPVDHGRHLAAMAPALTPAQTEAAARILAGVEIEAVAAA